MTDGLISSRLFEERIEAQCACAKSGSDRVHSSSDRVCSRIDRVRSGRDRMRSNGIGYGSGSYRVRSYGDWLDLDLGSSRIRID